MALPLHVIEESASARVAPLKGVGDDQVLVHEIYLSLQGEGAHTGLPCAFVRTTACHLRCVYCDTPHAFFEGSARAVPDVVREVLDLGVGLVLVTGGEPLLQRAVPSLLRALCDGGVQVLLETSGAVSTENVDERVQVILDVKTPGSGESARNHEANFGRLRPKDEVKYVICDDADYDWAVAHARQHGLADRCQILFSPEAERMNPTKLADRIVADRLNVRFQLQLHRRLWGDARGV